MALIIDIFLTLLALYFSLGLLFGIFFLFKGATKIDPILANSKKKVRVLLLPGVIAIWPFLVKKAYSTKNT